MFTNTGILFCLTGTMSTTRRNIESFIRVQGGRTSNTLNATVQVLVVGKNGGSTKLTAARLNGKLVITEEELYIFAKETPSWARSRNLPKPSDVFSRIYGYQERDFNRVTDVVFGEQLTEATGIYYDRSESGMIFRRPKDLLKADFLE